MGRAPCCSKDDPSLSRGAWTAKEDMILREYIEMHGEGGWRSLPTQAGIKRCGKSCRLRWLNYLRPNIKRGNISREEEELIIRMHRLLGNRWSLIAGRLPGRTDNEIKNYWNTRLKRKKLLMSHDHSFEAETKVDMSDNSPVRTPDLDVVGESKSITRTTSQHQVVRTTAIRCSGGIASPGIPGTASRIGLQPINDDSEFVHLPTSIKHIMSVESQSPSMDRLSPSCSLPAVLVDQEFITNCEHLETNAITCQSISDSKQFSGSQECCILPVSPLNSSIVFEIEDDQFMDNMQLSHTDDDLQEEWICSMNQNNNCDNNVHAIAETEIHKNTQHPLDWVGEEYLHCIFECGNRCQQDERDWEDDYRELFADM